MENILHTDSVTEDNEKSFFRKHMYYFTLFRRCNEFCIVNNTKLNKAGTILDLTR